jgi:hypothetical protein
MKISDDFSLEEFCHPDDPIAASDDAIVAKVKRLASEFLEPIRAHFAKPVDIRSAYRSLRHNAVVGGVPTSYHLYAYDHAAVDFLVRGVPLQEVFDWIRLESHLAFDQVILERAKGRTDDLGGVIHLQIRAVPRRMALVGSTHGQGGYGRVPVNA